MATVDQIERDIITTHNTQEQIITSVMEHYQSKAQHTADDARSSITSAMVGSVVFEILQELRLYFVDTDWSEYLRFKEEDNTFGDEADEDGSDSLVSKVLPVLQLLHLHLQHKLQFFLNQWQFNLRLLITKQCLSC